MIEIPTFFFTTLKSFFKNIFILRENIIYGTMKIKMGEIQFAKKIAFLCHLLWQTLIALKTKFYGSKIHHSMKTKMQI